jgi:ATP-dependent helicase/nuclease subunit A
MIDDGRKNDDRLWTDDEDASVPGVPGPPSPVSGLPGPPSPVSGRRSPVSGLPSPPSLKPEQQLAAHTLDRHVSVTAGPGAGKTTVLVERYLHILRNENISVDQIVAITFTNRAANEMRERLRHELDKILARAGPRERARWMRHKRTLDGAIITTIHGFCARLLREFPVEADLDPQFALLDAHQSSMLEESVAEETITEFISAEVQAITELAAGIGRVRLARGLIGIYRSMRNQGLTIEKLRAEAGRNHQTIDDYNSALQELAAKMREFIRARDLPASAESKRREAERHWPALLESLSNVSAATPPAELASAIIDFREAARPKAQGRIAETIKALDELLWDEKLRSRVPQCFFDLQSVRYTRELIAVVEALERRLDERKRQRSALDFDDLQLRALKLLEDHPEVMSRTSRRYRFFLIDEFQDTNSLQRKLTAKLALGRDRRANLFIVGDRKQSIYGFRGADVDVFREMTELIEAQNGLSVPLNRNFRSQRSLIGLFNFLFERVFEHNRLDSNDLNELGYVAHEASVAARDDDAISPAVELLVDVRDSGNSDDKWSRLKPRERDAEQLATRISLLVENESRERNEGAGEERSIHYHDIAMLFRAMTEVHIYESALRRAGIPYVTVDGKGFYAREEIADFIQLLRFLDNKTDEVALAAVLRSPFCGLSDDALFALRCAPVEAGVDELGSMSRHKGVRPLLRALRQHELISGIDDNDRDVLDRARELLDEMIARAKRASVSELLRYAADASEYKIITAANFDGAQRLANIEKLFTLAERFERPGAYLIRDFVRFVRDFEEAGGRESEGQIDESADAVRLMSIHQSKGLEFPVVIIPDLHRQPDNRIEWWALDRHRGLTVKVPDGRGRLAAGSCYAMFGDRAKLREEFESMRLLYVAATRAEDRLILSGAAKDLRGLGGSWLEWVLRALAAGSEPASRMLKLAEGVDVRLTVKLLDAEIRSSAEPIQTVLPLPADDSFPLLAPVEAERGTGLHRFSVTQLLNYSRCPRQYYFDRVLHTPSEDQLRIWNDADAPEPPSNLTATLKGAVIHRFCERFAEGDDIRELLTKSFEEVLRQRAAELAERVLEIDPEKAIRHLLPLAENYVTSDVRRRIEATRARHSALSTQHSVSTQHSLAGVLSEQRFRLRRPLGILTGTIDKLLISSSEADGRMNIEIIDFKTNRFRGLKRESESAPHLVIGKQSAGDATQLSFGFLTQGRGAHLDQEEIVQSEIRAAANDYQIQMQAYALAARELIPEAGSVRVTLHFLDPNVEVSLPAELLEAEACASAIDEAMLSIVSSSAPESFDPKPADHCRVCNFSDFCEAGRQWLARAQV